MSAKETQMEEEEREQNKRIREVGEKLAEEAAAEKERKSITNKNTHTFTDIFSSEKHKFLTFTSQHFNSYSGNKQISDTI